MNDLNHHQSATAHRSWDQKWQTDSGRSDWLKPESDVLQTIDLFEKNGINKVLDLGCGVGRHSLALSRAGMEVWAVDMSPAGLSFAQKEAEDTGLAINFKQSEMTALPFEDASFDYVLAWNVIYHGVHEVVRKSLAEIHRVLRPQGWLQCTMLSKRHVRFGQGREVAPDVWIKDDSGESDHAHPHFYCNAAELVRYFQGFELLSLADKAQRRPDTYHWVVLAEKI